MNQVMNLVGLTAIVTISTGTAVLAKPVIYAETGGLESLILYPNGLAVLETIGLTLKSANSTTTPKPGYDIGALLLP
ncbi:MAG: PEP-CTERM sorting domain-containing protein, partial [Microcystis sp.]